MINYEAIGQKIRKARQDKNMKQFEFADKMGVSVGFVSQVESGQKCFNVNRLEEVSNILEKPVGYFVEGMDADDERAMIQEIEFLLRNISRERIPVIEKLFREVRNEI